MVVFFAEVAEPYLTQIGRGVCGECLGTLLVGEVSACAADAVLQIWRVGALFKHLRVVVGLEYKVVGFSDGFCYGRCDFAHICGEAEGKAFCLYFISYTVGTVVRYLKRSDDEIANLCTLSFIEIAAAVLGDFRSSTIVVVDADVYLLSGIDGLVHIVGQMSYGLDMVGMVVCHEDGADLLNGETITRETLFEVSEWYSGIDEYATLFCLEVVAIAAAATPQA